MQRLLLVLTFGSLLTCSVFASQANEAPQAVAKPLTNLDVADMLGSGLSPEIVIAKIKGSACGFDTAPAALKALKAASVPDAVILAMVQAPAFAQSPAGPVPSTSGRVGYVKCGINGAEVYLLNSPTGSPVATMKCGTKLALLGQEAGYFKARTEDGAEGYISHYFVSVNGEVPLSTEKSAESSKEGPPNSQPQKEKEIQIATDDRDDCNLGAQNEYQTKMNVLATMALAPMMRVAASNRLKQNLDSELRECRSRYEMRLKSIENE